MDFCVTGDDFVLERVQAVAQDEAAVDADVANSGAIEAEDDERKEIVGGVAGDGNVV